MDDFLRNFFVKMGLSRTCETFEAEWYELKATGRLEGNTQVPDVYQRNMALEEEVAVLRAELNEAHGVASRASTTWDSFRKERDFHRMHHKRVAQEKNKLITDIKRLKEHFAKYEPTILELKRKYETAMKEKMLVSLERDKLAARLDTEVQQSRSMLGPMAATGPSNLGTTLGSTLQGTTQPGMGERGSMGGSAGGSPSTSRTANGLAEGTGGTWTGRGGPGMTTGTVGTTGSRGPTKGRSGWATITAPQPRHPYTDMEFAPANPKAMALQKTFKGHLLSVANMALHPTKPILVTASDDKTWKMWHMPAGDLIMCGEGHKDWVAGVDFNPSGASLASGGGDAAVKVWDFAQQRCVLTFTDHKQAVWGVRYHHSGDVLASCSLDHTRNLTHGQTSNQMKAHLWQSGSSMKNGPDHRPRVS
uniref:Uncharacterized protein n=1 Tax=Dunaliella tertiolecta TaxID=3047 RepID=A0A7S3QVU9_DUNTE